MNTREQNIILDNWEQFYDSKGVESELTKVYMAYVEKLVKQSLPPIFDFRHLSLLLNINEYDLASIVNSPNSYYRTFDIPKKKGGFRTITAPHSSLKNIQKWIYYNILNNIKIHGCAHGFAPSKSILTNANVHINQKYLLKIDLKDFFPSIPMSYVLQLFKSLGYTSKVAFYLSSLCCYDGCLAQGSPVSPVISNVIAKHLDRRLYRIAKKYNLEVLAKVPIDSKIAEAVDKGEIEQLEGTWLDNVATYLENNLKIKENEVKADMKIAVPCEEDNINEHYGKCTSFKVFVIKNGELDKKYDLSAMNAEHETVSQLLKDESVDTVLCGGIGQGAMESLFKHNIVVIPGLKGNVDVAVGSYLDEVTSR